MAELFAEATDARPSPSCATSRRSNGVRSASGPTWSSTPRGPCWSGSPCGSCASYAVPVADLLVAARAGAGRPAAGPPAGRLRRRPAAARPERAVRGAHRRRRAGDGPGGGAPAAGFRRDPDLAGYVILDFDGVRLARGGRADRGPPARPVPPDRRPPELAPGPDRARGARCSRSRARPRPAVRGHVPAAALLPAARGRGGDRSTRASCGRPAPTRATPPTTTSTAGERRAAEHRVELRGAARRRDRGRPACVSFYQERRRRLARRRAGRAGADALVELTPSVVLRLAARSRRRRPWARRGGRRVGMMKFGFSSSSLTTSAIASAARSSMSVVISEARASSRPRKTPGNASTLLIWFG